jgi:ribosomal protein L11 methylase PrmA
MPCAAEDYEFVRQTGFLSRQIEQGRVIAETPVDPGVLGEFACAAYAVIEHPRLSFVSYAYEWPFPALKQAALLQLNLCLEGLEAGVMLSDASAYNVQFQGARPIFIDSLSFRRYREGQYWTAHRQFCEQFLNPLLLRALCGVPHNAWYRGSPEGIAVHELARVLPWRSRLSWNTLVHVHLQERLQRGARSRGEAERHLSTRKLPQKALSGLLRGLRDWIARLEPADTGKTGWDDYADDNSYSPKEAAAKRALVDEFAASVRPRVLWDIGCNTGVYSEAALMAGAGQVIGFDFDQGALDKAFARARAKRLDFLPLFMDAGNPSPDQGWAQRERPGLARRANADAVLALAMVHHLAISRNVPLQEVVDWLVGLAPAGLIEFVPPEDPMVQRLLSLRENVFTDYREADFAAALQARARIVSATTVSASQRKLFRFERERTPGE